MRQREKLYILDWLSYAPEYRQKCIDFANEAIKRVADRLNIEQYNNPDNTRQAVFSVMYRLVETEIAPENPDSPEFELFNSLTERPFDFDLHSRTKMELHRILEQYIKEHFTKLS